MTATTSFQTWQELFAHLTAHPEIRKRIARELKVNPYTVQRWGEGKSQPRPQYLAKFPELFPEYKQLFTELLWPELFSPGNPTTTSFALQGEILARILDAYATISGPFRSWEIRFLALQQAIEHLDIERVGMEISIIQCVPPMTAEERIRSLCEIMTVGSDPWEQGIRKNLIFLGAESLSGWTVAHGQPGIVQNILHPATYSLKEYDHEQGAVTWPIQRKGKVAGCLLVVSGSTDYFSKERLAVIESITNAVALSFDDEEFYSLSRITLHEFPQLSSEHHKALLDAFGERVRALRRDQQYVLSIIEAEQLALQQMAEELLGESRKKREEDVT